MSVPIFKDKYLDSDIATVLAVYHYLYMEGFNLSQIVSLVYITCCLNDMCDGVDHFTVVSSFICADLACLNICLSCCKCSLVFPRNSILCVLSNNIHPAEECD